MPIVHRSEKLVLRHFDAIKVLHEVGRVLSRHWPILIPADEKERSADDHEEDDGEEAEGAHVDQNDHID